MVIDLKKCTGCRTCVISCKVENGTQPGVFWNRVGIKEEGVFPNVRRIPVPVACQHCEDPPCVKVCPSKASIRREDGIVIIDEDKCIGCRYCMMACPYGARFFIDHLKNYFPNSITPFEKWHREKGWHKHTKGVCEKCDFCLHRVERGLKKGLKPGINGDATPKCVVDCPSKARYFGDLDDPTSEVSQLIRKYGGFRLLKEIGTNPSVYYLPP
ncbi:MAG: 4Fe-4S dicluster domain-containing protein [Nitrososphaeria archaeon]